MKKKLRRGKEAVRTIKVAGIVGIVVGVVLFAGAIWVWSSAATAEETGHVVVYPAEAVRDVAAIAGLFILAIGAISLGSAGNVAKALQSMSADEDDE